jgi:hypothetical protein
MSWGKTLPCFHRHQTSGRRLISLEAILGDAVSCFAHLAPAGVCQVAEPPRRYYPGNMDNRNATTCTRPWVVCSSTIR